MNKTGEKLITKLVEEKNYPPTSKTYIISLYIDTFNIPREDVYTVLNSYLKKAFLSEDKLKEEGYREDDIQEEIKTILTRMESFNRGVGIFVKFSLDSREIEVKVFDSPVQFTNDVFLGKVYKVDQLVWATELVTTSLVVSIDRQEATIYELKDDIFTEVEAFENEHIDSEEREYREKFRPTTDDKVMHGTGDIGEQREEKQDNRRFFKDVYEAFRERFNDISEYEYVVFFPSDSYDPLIGQMKESFKNDYDTELVVKSVQMDEVEDLEIESKKLIRGLKREAKKDHLEISKSNPDLYADGFKEVADASRFRKIDTIYVKKGVKNPGYISHEDLIYTYPVKDSEMVDDIAPWLFKNVLENSGQLYVFDEEGFEPESDISARLRF